MALSFAWPRAWRKRSFASGKTETKSFAPRAFTTMHFASSPGWTSHSYAGLVNEGYMKNPVVYRCVRMVAEAAASVPWIAYEGDQEIQDHPAIISVRRPNPLETGAQFLEALFGHLLLSGNAYLERHETLDGAQLLYALRPDQVSVTADADGWPGALIVGHGSAKRELPLHADGRPGQALHLQLFHPLSDTSGFSPLQAAVTALDVHNAASVWNKALLDNSARPSGALVYAPGDNGNLTAEQFDALKAQLEDGYSGAANAGRPLLLEGGLDWKSMALSPQEMDFVQTRNMAAREIALAFGVPPMLLGIPGDNTYSNYQEAQRAFYRLTVLPLLKRTTAAFSHWLEPVYGARFRLDFDSDQIEGLSAERDSLWARLEQASFLTEKEKRQAVGYSPEPEVEQ